MFGKKKKTVELERGAKGASGEVFPISGRIDEKKEEGKARS